MKAKVIELKPNVNKPVKRWDKNKFYTCNRCAKKYHTDLMINYYPPNYGYYGDEGTHYCIKCYNGKF